MLNIVLGTTLGLNMAVVRFFGDYLDLERHRTENNTREEEWLELSSSRRLRGLLEPQGPCGTRPSAGEATEGLRGTESEGQERLHRQTELVPGWENWGAPGDRLSPGEGEWDNGMG